MSSARLNWDNLPDLDRRLVELTHELAPLEGPALHREIARVLNDEFAFALGTRFSEDKIRNRMKRVRFEALGDRPVTIIMPYFERHADVITGDAAAPEKVVGGRTLPQHLAWMLEGRKKTLVLSDIHIPMQDDALIQHAVERNLTADLVVVNGDLIDAYALSTFVKSEDVPIYAEIDGCVRFLEWLSGLFPDAFIVITRGNHEARVQKRILPMLPDGLSFLAKTDVVAELARPFPNVAVIDDWFVQVGDAIYAHAEAASGQPAKPAVDTLNWFINHQEELGLKPFRLVVQAHTHRISVVYQGRYKAVESGCLCHSMGYARTTRHKYPQQQGFVVSVQQDGAIDFHQSREYPLGLLRAA